jgi:threonine dehydratase
MRMTLQTEPSKPGPQDIIAASERISGYIRKTPVINEPSLDAVLGCRLWLKCENRQETGAFKFRGANNAIQSLRELGETGDVATHSSGNHGAALARAANLDGRTAHVVMPKNSVPEKIDAVKRFGGNVIFCEPNQSARDHGLAELVALGHISIHPYEHLDIIAGQGTAALEFLTTNPGLDILITPVGGGGLISGSALIAKHLQPELLVWGAEPLGAADTAESLKNGERVQSWDPETIADGLRAIIGEMTFPIIRSHVGKVLTVSESGLVKGMELVYLHTGMIIEPSSATVIAAMLEHPGSFEGRNVGAILSGGNIDSSMFPQFSGTGDD